MSDEAQERIPRILTILGIVPDRVFYIKYGNDTLGPYVYDKIHNTILKNGTEISTFHLLYAINHPECVVTTAQLSEKDIQLCKLIGVTYVSRDKYSTSPVFLWNEEPKCNSMAFYQGHDNSRSIGHFVVDGRTGLFKNLQPGDCVCVKDMEEGVQG